MDQSAGVAFAEKIFVSVESLEENNITINDKNLNHNKTIARLSNIVAFMQRGNVLLKVRKSHQVQNCW